MNTQILNLTAAEFYSSIGGATLLLAALQFFLMAWFKARIEASLKAEYDRQLSDYKHELDKNLEKYRNDFKVREQAAKVAELMAYARWHQGETSGEKFDHLAWELSLWLPRDIICQLTECLVHGGNIGELKQILISVRRLLLQNPADALVADNILHSVMVQAARA